MKKLLVTILAICLIIAGGVFFYLKTQIDNANNEIVNLTSVVRSQEVAIAEMDSELDLTASKLKETEVELDLTKSRLEETETELTNVSHERDEVLELNDDLAEEMVDTKQQLVVVEMNLKSQKAATSELQTELEAMQEELQLYHDTGISVAQGIVPPYVIDAVNSPARLDNNIEAEDVSWSELEDFLLEDRTDNNVYITGVYMCGGFALDLHNNAEERGIKAAWVAIDFEDGSTSHALNAFVTTDRGLVFIDATGVQLGGSRPQHLDRIVYVNVGKRLTSRLLFASPDWHTSMANSIVSRVKIYW